MLYLGNQIGGSDVDEVAGGKRQQKRHIKCEGDINNTISENRLRRLKPSQPVVRPIGNVIDRKRDRRSSYSCFAARVSSHQLA